VKIAKQRLKQIIKEEFVKVEKKKRVELEESRVGAIAAETRKIASIYIRWLKSKVVSKINSGNKNLKLSDYWAKKQDPPEDGILSDYALTTNGRYHVQSDKFGPESGTVKSILDVEFRFMPGPGLEKAEIDIRAGGSYTPRADQSKFDEMVIKIFYNPLMTGEEFTKSLENIYFNITKTISHELEHMDQKASGRMRDFTVDEEAYKIYSEGGWIGYLGSKEEVEAWARGAYTMAMKQRVPWESVLDEMARQLEVAIKDGGADPNASEIEKQDFENIDSVVKFFRDSQLEYVRKNLPCAQMKNGKPINPSACKSGDKTSVAKIINKVVPQEGVKEIKSFFYKLKNVFKKAK
jgi:hypothetical protein